MSYLQLTSVERQNDQGVIGFPVQYQSHISSKQRYEEGFDNL